MSKGLRIASKLSFDIELSVLVIERSISYSNGPHSVQTGKHNLVDCCVNKET